MKNIVYIDIDTDREQPVKVGKAPDFKLPETKEKDQEVTQLDVKSLVEGILVMGIYMEEKDYQTFDDTLDDVMEQLREGWANHMNTKDLSEGSEDIEEKE